jgi:hypothetical protein
MASNDTILSNGIISVSFELEKQTISILDYNSGEKLLCESRIGLPTRGSTSQDLKILKKEKVDDCLGLGEKWVLELNNPSLYRYSEENKPSKIPPSQLLTFTLYENNSALIMGFGLKTPTFYRQRLTQETLNIRRKAFRRQ